MAALKQNTYYRVNQVTTASRGQLLLTVYDGLLRFLAEGKQAMQKQQYEKKNHYLKKAEDLIVVLLLTLDHTINPELASNLDRLYRYMYDRMVEANIHDDAHIVASMMQMATDLRATWAEAELVARRDDESYALAGGSML